MSGYDDSSLSTKQHAALVALLNEPTLGAAAQEAGCTEQTLRRWLRQPAFAAAYRRARQQALAQAVGGLHAVAGEAVRTLRSAMAGPNPADAVRAAEAVLAHAFRSAELVDLADRMDELERRLDGAGSDELPASLDNCLPLLDGAGE